MAIQLTKKQKIYLAAGGVALLALGFDRMFPAEGGETRPAVAEAAPAATPLAARKPAAAAASASNPEPLPAGPSVAARIAEAAKAANYTGADIRDAFRVPASWRPAEHLTEPAAPRFDADKFTRDHRLTGVLTAGDRSVALVDGKPMQIGQTLDGFTLVSVEQSRALWEADGVRVVMQLPATGPGTR